MKIAQFCTFPHGGAATAAIRHHHALLRQGLDSRFFYHRNQQRGELDATFTQIEFPPTEFRGWSGTLKKRQFKRQQRKIYDLYNRHLATRSAADETFSMARLPDSTRLDWPQIDAEIAHFHWLAYFADFESFFRSIPDQVPLIWTLHDTHAFTGGCHYPSGCASFRFGCGNCPQLIQPGFQDASRDSFEAKQRAFQGKRMDVVAPCDWMLTMAQQSRIWPEATRFHKIEYGLNLDQFRPLDRNTARQRLGIDTTSKLIAFGAVDIDNPRKGFQFLRPALNQLAGREQDTGGVECLAFGSGQLVSDRPLPRVHHFGFVESRERQREIYSAADLLVLPSMEDNQPQVGLEAMACGTPVVAFDACGLPEYVQHEQNGLLARAKDSADLARQIERLLGDDPYRLQLGQVARKTVEQRFEEGAQTQKYIDLYAEVAERRRSAAA